MILNLPAGFDPVMRDRHPWVQCVVGMSKHGKSCYVNLCLALWGDLGRRSLAIDAVCPRSPEPRGKHIAGWATGWVQPCELQYAPAGFIPPSVSLLAADEAALCLTASRKEFVPVRDAVQRGQHHGLNGISALLATQRLVQVHPDAWDNAGRYVIFRTQGENDLARIAKLPGMTDRALRMIPALPPGYAVVCDVQDGLWVPIVEEWKGAA